MPAPACARRAIIVVGRSWTLDVFTTRKRTIALLARPSGLARAMVFIAEQKVPRELEFDEDDKTAEHFISFDARHMVTGCARLLDNGRIGRVAVLRPFRGRGIGEAVMKTVLERAKARGMKDVHLAAQVQAMPFYERLGFEPFGDEFDEAGIPHRMMRLVF